MVNSIPPPDLPHLLPAFLSHIPASFASPKTPPSLPPLLAPITRSRLTHLAFNNTTSFLSLLCWSSNPADGEKLHEHLTGQDYYFLHQTPSPGTFIFKGARRLDSETVQSLVQVPELSVLVIYQFIAPREDEPNEWDQVSDEETYGWKVLDLRLDDDEEQLGTWYASIDAAEEAYREEKYNALTSENVEVMDNDEDDYWGRYDDEDTESSAGDRPSTSHTHQSHSSQVQYAAPTAQFANKININNMTKDEDDYYSRYADIQPVLEDPSSDHNPNNNISHTRNMSNASSADSHAISDTHLSLTNNSTPLTSHTQTIPPSSPTVSTNTKIKKLEETAELHTQAEVAIKQHVSTSIKSLWRLWKASGGDMEDFQSMIEREVEVLKMMEEGEELGS